MNVTCLVSWVGFAVSWSGAVTTPAVYESDGVTVITPAAPVDISLYTFRLTVKAKYSDPDSAAIYQYQWQIPAGAGTSGLYSAVMPDGTTQNLSPETLVWDIQYIAPGATGRGMFLTGTLAIGNTVGTTQFTP